MNSKSLKHILFRLTILVGCLWMIQNPSLAQADSLSVDASQLKDTTKQVSRPKSKIELIYADRGLGEHKLPNVNIFVGNVHFVHNGMNLFCDSILFNRISNTIEAFDNVRMEQGDTLFIYGDYLHYDGEIELARLRDNIRMENISTTLTTDSLNFDRIQDLGYYFNGGTLKDTINLLVSDWGEYSPSTKVAKFKKEVHLTNDQMELFSDTLIYNTDNTIATILGPSEILSAANKILSTKGFYNTSKEQAELLNRSQIYTEGKILTGDSLYYDRLLGIGEAFQNIEMTDTINKNLLTGNYCYYDERLQNAFATDRAVAIDYSQGDSLYIHGDTLRLNTYDLNTDSVFREVRVYDKVRIFRDDLQGVCDTLIYNSKDSCITLLNDPVVWNGTQQLLGEKISLFMNDSTIDRAHIEKQALAVEQKDSLHYNQISGNEIEAFFQKGQIHQIDVSGNVIVGFYPEEKDLTLLGLIRAETSFMTLYIANMQMQKMKMFPQSNGVLYPFTQIPADQLYLDNFVWLEYLRPKSKEDIFNWVDKKPEHKLKKSTPELEKPKIDPRSIKR